MTTLTLKFQLEESLVLAYRQAMPKEKADLKRLFEKLLAVKFRKQAIEDMFQKMEHVGSEAQANGLSEDIIDEILLES
jgi:ribosome-binding protein aMBF1 (putative translation factor)